MLLDFGQLMPFMVNFDKYLYKIINQNTFLAYLIVFLIVFSEVGLIIMTFLPGDSLIFVTGALTSLGLLNLPLVFIMLCSAVVLGDSVCYSIGKYLGKRIMKKEQNRFFKKEYIKEAHEFYEKHGKVAIIMGRFIPVIRSFVAFVAGIGSMSFYRLILYSAIGGILRVSAYLFGGYYFGSFEIVRKNLVFAIMLVSIFAMLPAVVGIIKQGAKKYNNN